jgi:parallel beta-helix repeat protein
MKMNRSNNLTPFLLAAAITGFGLHATASGQTSVDKLGAATGWFSADTRSAAGTGLRGLVKTVPGYDGNGTVGYTAADDDAIGGLISFGDYYPGSSGGVMRLHATAENAGKADAKFFFAAPVAPAGPALAAINATYRYYNDPQPTSRTPALNITVLCSDNIVRSFAYVAEGQGVGWNQPTLTATTTTTVTGTGLFLYGGGAPGGTVSKSMTDWLADPVWGPLVADGQILGHGFNLGSWQRQNYVGIDWLESSLIDNGARVDFIAYFPVRNLTQNTGHNTIQAAITAANDGDTIQAVAGTYTEGPIALNKAIALQGPNAGLAGDDLARGPEARIENSKITVTAAATIDGFEIYQTDNSADGLLMQAAATVTNSVIRRDGITTGNTVRGLSTSVGLSGYSISGNLFTGDSSGGFFSGHKTWNSGIYINGGTGTISGNTFENCRTAINLDDFNTGITVSGNTFRTCGTYLSFGGTTPTAGSNSISGNEFFLDWANIATNWLPSALFNNSNVATTFRINATDNTFGGVATTALTNDQKFAIEARNFHRGRSGRNGVVDFVADQQVVVAGLTTIASAIAAAGVGDSVLASPGTYNEDVDITKAGLTLQGAGVGQSTIVGPIGGISMTVKISATDVTVDGFTITRAGNNPTDWNNTGLNTAGGVHIQTVANATVTNNEITGNRTGIDINNSSGHTIRNNVISNNRTGMLLRNTTDNLTVTENEITDNWTVGILFLDMSGGSNSPVQSALNCQFINNDIRGNWYGQIVDRQTGGSLPAPGANPKNFEKNWLGTTAPWVSTANSTEPGYAAQIPVAFGGTATPPAAAQPDILGSASANIDYLPLLASGVDTNVETVIGRGTYGFQGNLSNTISSGLFTNTVITTPQVFADLLIGSGTKVTVTGTGASLTVTGELGLAPGATLEVINGSLTINGSTLSGTFTFFNSFGSVNFNDDVTITGSADGLILISDVHVANGAVITVNGTLVIDGCVVDSTGNFDLVVNSGAKFTMARTVFADGDITVNSADTAIYDNRFETSTIAVGAGAAAARIYHNLTDSLGWLSGAAVTTVDGWGNVTDASVTENNLFLGLDPGALVNATNGRTKDAGGNVFIQPTDSITASLDVSDLQSKIAAVEVLLGYNTGLLGAAPLALDSDWNVLLSDVDDDSTVIGKLDAAIGLSTTYADPAGSDADDTIATVALIGKAVEGETLFFQRVKLAGVVFGGETRLATGGPSPAFLTPFTANSASIVLDGSEPTVIVDSLVNATQVQVNVPSPVDVLDPSPATPPAYAFRNGNPLVITFTASDAGLAGLDAADAVNDLELSATNGSTVMDSWTVAATEDTLTGVVTYTVTLALPADATNGTYTVTAAVRDRSGNWSDSTPIGYFAITYEVLANVELQGLAFPGGTGTREVVFVATNAAGAWLKTWPAKTITFTGALGSTVLDAVPDTTASISAKTAWNLRSKVAASLVANGIGTASLTATNRLPGGDLNGDNVVNTLDYSILRFYWLTANPTADIDGSGSVSTGDYSLLRGNFYTTGDPQ